jgi:hypothetical protein
MNIRKTLLTKLKEKNVLQLRRRYMNFIKVIRYYFHYSKSKEVVRYILPGNSGLFWKAVIVTKDMNTNKLLNFMCYNDVEIAKCKRKLLR